MRRLGPVREMENPTDGAAIDVWPRWFRSPVATESPVCRKRVMAWLRCISGVQRTGPR